MEVNKNEGYFEDKSGFSDSEFQELICKYKFYSNIQVQFCSYQVYDLQSALTYSTFREVYMTSYMFYSHYIVHVRLYMRYWTQYLQFR